MFHPWLNFPPLRALVSLWLNLPHSFSFLIFFLNWPIPVRVVCVVRVFRGYIPAPPLSLAAMLISNLWDKCCLLILSFIVACCLRGTKTGRGSQTKELQMGAVLSATAVCGV